MCGACGATETQAIEAKCNTGEISSLGDLQDALESTGNDKLELKLPNSITINEPITIANEKNVTIDLNGNTLTLDSDKTANVVSVNGTLKITNGNVVIARPEGEAAIYMQSGICVKQNGTLVIDKANITADRLWNIENNGTTTITRSTITVTGGFGIDSKKGKVVIENSTLVADGEATTQIYCRGGEMEITDTVFDEGTNFQGYYDHSPIRVFHEDAKVTLDNVTIKTNDDVDNIYASEGCEVVINSGTFNGVLSCTSGATITLYGGTFCGVEFANITETSTGFFDNLAAKITQVDTQEGKAWVITVGHEHHYTPTVVTEPTCTERGYTTYTCSCGHSYKADYVEALNHTDADNDGDHICDRTGCNADNVTEHTYGDLIGKKAATCSETGMSAHYKCSECSKLFNEYKVAKTEADLTIAIDENAHAYGDWTSTSNGTHTRVCSLNNAHTENGNCAGGTASCTQKAVCTTCKAEYGNLADHTYQWKNNDDVHWEECSCGDKISEAGHNYVDGKTCSVCGKVKPAELPTGATTVIKGGSAGTLDGIKINENSGQTFTTTDNTFSVSFWLKTNNITPGAVIFTNQEQSGYGGYGFYFNEKGQLTFFASGGRGADILLFTEALNVSNWTHITCVVNVNTVTVYVNGEKVSDKTSNDEAGAITGDTLCIGKYKENGGTFSSETYMDEFMVFDRYISAEEVKQIYDYYPQN